MAEPHVVEALLPLAEALEALGIRYYVVGSVASSLHGVARASLDADIVAELSPLAVDELIARLEHVYYIPRARLRSAAAERTSCNLIHLATAFKIDLFVSKGRPIDMRAADRARAASLVQAANTRSFPVASREDVVLAKLEWFRRGGETSESQWWDILGLLKVADQPDWAYLEQWAGELGIADLLQRVRDDAVGAPGPDE